MEILSFCVLVISVSIPWGCVQIIIVVFSFNLVKSEQTYSNRKFENA